jgi:glutamine synthetase-like protein
VATVSTKQDLIREDVKRLHGLGYAQELFREMGGFSNFAISFTIISILTGDAYEAEAQHQVPRVPGALYEAIHGLEHSQLAREAFGERVVAHYLNAAQQEQAAYDHAVTCWELDRYFERI